MVMICLYYFLISYKFSHLFFLPSHRKPSAHTALKRQDPAWTRLGSVCVHRGLHGPGALSTQRPPAS